MDQAIVDQIESRTLIHLWSNDFQYPELIALYEQSHGAFVEFPGFGYSKEIRPTLTEWIKDQFTDEQQFNTDPEVIRWPGSFDRFVGRLDPEDGPVILSTGYCVLERGEDRGWLNAGYDMTKSYCRAQNMLEQARTEGRPENQYKLKFFPSDGDAYDV